MQYRQMRHVGIEGETQNCYLAQRSAAATVAHILMASESRLAHPQAAPC